jgi:uncharacterized phiE125 gp8 family phage protein
MYTSTQVTVDPASEPVTAANVRDQLRLDGTDQDTMIGVLITACRLGLEAEMRRSFITQTRVTTFDSFEEVLELPFAPISAVVVTYVDTAGDTQTLSADDYDVDTYGEPARVGQALSAYWPAIASTVLNPVTVTCTCGYGAASDVPVDIKQAIIAMVIDLYEHPELSPEQIISGALHRNAAVDRIIELRRIPKIAI